MPRDVDSIFSLYLEAYNAATVQKLIQKYQQEKRGLDEDGINFYIKRFDQVKTSPKLVEIAQKLGVKNPRDITQYSWNQLEQVVDQFPVKSKEQIQQHADNADLIYNKNGVEIYKADTKEKCIYYGQHHFGHQYSFCISRPKDGNLYSNYRLEGRTFYFVRDKKYNKEDVTIQKGDQSRVKFGNANHLIVIHATPDPKQFHATDADNHGDEEMYWDEIENRWPKLRGLRELFKFVPFNDEERKQWKLRNWNWRSFAHLTPDERNEFINSDYLFVPSHVWAKLSPELAKRYIEVRRDLSQMFVLGNNHDQTFNAEEALQTVRRAHPELTSFAYELTRKEAIVKKKEYWILLDNAIISPYARDFSGSYGTYSINIASLDKNMSSNWADYHTAENLIVDQYDGRQWKIENNKLVVIKGRASETDGSWVPF